MRGTSGGVGSAPGPSVPERLGRATGIHASAGATVIPARSSGAVPLSVRARVASGLHGRAAAPELRQALPS